MRHWGLIAALVLAAAPPASYAQTAQQPGAAAHRSAGPNLEAQRAAMARLQGLTGNWQGEASVLFPRQITVFQTERVEADMDGLLLLVRGAGYASADRAGAPTFNALGVISYDDARQIYEFRVYNDGRAATAEARFLDDGRLQWTMNFAPTIIRYTIAVDGDAWTEIGEMSRDNGATWTRTIEMHLSRIAN